VRIESPNYALHVNQENGMLKGLRRMNRLIDKKGNRYGKLIVIEKAGRDKSGNALWECICDCGNIKTIAGNHLQSGHTKSCGCFKNKRNGLSSGRIYCIWDNMVKRCSNKNRHDYKHYGGRGIKVCEEWLEFLSFYEWATGHGYRKGFTIERTNNEIGYSPDNCIWIPFLKQSRNKRIYKNNKTGRPGVYWHNKNKKYVAWFSNHRKIISLGSFTNIEDAITARKAAELKYWGKAKQRITREIQQAKIF
jgi:hypothetical protein